MYECCLHTLRVFLLRYGWTSGDRSADGDGCPLWFEPVPEITSRLRCRGQVTAATGVVRYEIHIKSLEYTADEVPQAVAGAVMYADHRPIVHMENLCLRLRGVSRTGLRRAWSGRRAWRAAGDGPPRQPLFGHDRILEFASGLPSRAFGAGYAEFDHGRKLARLPRPPFNFLHRVIDVDGCEPWVLAPGARARAAFDARPGDWFFAEYGDRRLPYAVLLEAGLQACGWLAAYLGSALADPVDLAFRNLDGRARVHATVAEPEGDAPVTLQTEVELIEVSRAPQMIIQRYRLRIRAGDRDALSAQTTFGFFSAEALARQPGIAGVGAGPLAAGTAGNLAAADRARLLRRALPRGRLGMLETLDVYLPHAGPSELGYLRASARVDPGRWYFEAHFYQDPVCPGSLGLEAFIQLVRVAASHRWGHLDPHRGWVVEPGNEHEWKYRGQILPSSRSYTVEAVVDAVDDARHALTAGGLLHVDGCVIYRMERFTVVREESAADATK